MKTDIKSLRNKYSAKAKADGLDQHRRLLFQFQVEYNAARDTIKAQADREGVRIGALPIIRGARFVNEMLSDLRDTGKIRYLGYIMTDLKNVVLNLRTLGPSFLSRSRLPQMIESVIAHLNEIVKAIVQLIRDSPPPSKGEQRGRVNIKGVVDRIFYSFQTAGFNSSTNQIAYPGLSSILHLLSDATREAGIDHSVVDYIKNMSSQTHFPGGKKEYDKYIKDKKAEFATLLRSMSQLQLEDFAVIVGRSRAW